MLILQNESVLACLSAGFGTFRFEFYCLFCRVEFLQIFD